MRVTYFLFFAAAFFLFSCSLFSSPDSTTIGEIFPLANGNYWIYNVQSFDTSGKVTSNIPETTTITDSVKSGQAYEFSVTFGDGYTGIWQEDQTDLILQSDTADNPLPILRYPMDAGQTLPLTVGPLPGGETFQKNLTYHGNNESVTVDAGTFGCYHYEVSIYIDSTNGYNLAESQDSYYAANVGLVKEEDYTITNGVKKKYLEKDLASYVVR